MTYEVALEQGESFKVDSPCLIQYVDTCHPDAIVLEVEPVRPGDGPVDFVIEIGEKACPYGMIVSVSKWPEDADGARLVGFDRVIERLREDNVRHLVNTLAKRIYIYSKEVVGEPYPNLVAYTLEIEELLMKSGLTVRIDD